ncbi:hypothetical protein TcCL_Unassigned04810 [Trypanosoma cruzi]|uniref:Uncharacterized protein n=1 Tax=Trypanosoma cruzi (strain CL Brener) TaxID=353153 RepID=Q4D4I4_TRYCC|nr:hypothetical protein Tc00.1047053508745.25 [Trypanosoma cruzi]EAN87437.1 hypothetical protein Tc00.1047053508745.25 [Trypanosoma cruzi]RNC32564.1 hypothetical protein TcCL_Unassigned04810 [Trypanosoma cruzi]|eukprot:XP_809288.1 hypothetical protein [Trypanosoma cruzi strain CL Brener]
MHGRNGELCAVCHVADAVHTCSNCAARCATKEEKATVAFTMSVTTHKYAGPYELWWRQFSPDGTIHPPARRGDADQTGICQLPPPCEGRRMTQNLVGQLRRKLMLSRHVRTRISDSVRRLTDPRPSIGVPHPTRRPTRPRRGLSLPAIRTK